MKDIAATREKTYKSQAIQAVPSRGEKCAGVMNDNVSAVRTPLDGIPAGKDEPHPPPNIPDHELIRPIGSGSYGQVWLARNVMGTYRAVKIVYRHTFKEDHPFEREFNGTQKFEPVSRSHEGLVDILQVGRNDQAGYFYYVMELADDENSVQQINPNHYVPKTIGSRITLRGRLSVDECLRLGMSLTGALGHLHRHGLIHRDIKPSNIIFVNGIPKLADIGLVAGVSDARSYVGTDGFIPPEGPGAAQADIYSLGKVLYEISTGKDRQEFPELPTVVADLPDRERFLELNEVVNKACETDLRRRYGSAAEMHSELVLLSSGKSVKHLHLLERQLAIATRIAIILTALALVIAGAFYRAHWLSKKANERVVQLSVAYGVRLMDEGDQFGALLWFSKALSLVEGSAAQEEMHRYRLDSVLRQCPKLLQVYFHTRTVNHAEFSADGRRVVTASDDRTARVWDAVSGEAISPPLKHEREVCRAAFSPEGDRVVTASGEHTARVWDAVRGRTIRSEEHREGDEWRSLSWPYDLREEAHQEYS